MTRHAVMIGGGSAASGARFPGAIGHGLRMSEKCVRCKAAHPRCASLLRAAIYRAERHVGGER
ncbi:hypothetical protein [Nocardia sp. NPDC127526]|uniref:hypothetical protein n=1 Tax=Nocardia sp. NPDC127526 TaxID=3345393 RepID=UPI0036287CC2